MNISGKKIIGKKVKKELVEEEDELIQEVNNAIWKKITKAEELEPESWSLYTYNPLLPNSNEWICSLFWIPRNFIIMIVRYISLLIIWLSNWIIPDVTNHSSGILLFSKNFKIKRLVADYPPKDIDEKILLANYILRNLIRTVTAFIIHDSSKNPKNILYRDGHLEIPQPIHRVLR